MTTASGNWNQHIVSEIGSERATSGAGNKVATAAGRTHIVWQDVTADRYDNCIRTFFHDTNEWSDRVVLNQGTDNHARPVLAIDHEGTLHVILSGHNSPVTHRSSVRPHDSSEWTDETVIGKGTYPAILCSADNTLYVSMRNAERWNGVDLYIKQADGEWGFQDKLVKRREDLPGYAGYQSALAWSPDNQVLHFVTDFYESKEIYRKRGIVQAVCHLQSTDSGKTWQKADGSVVSLPARPQEMDVIAYSEGDRKQQMPPPVVLAQGCMEVDSAGTVFIPYLSHLDEPGELRLASLAKGGAWQHRSIPALAELLPDYRPVACRGGFTITADDELYLLIGVLPLGDGWLDGKPTRDLMFTGTKRLVMLHSADHGQSFTAQELQFAGMDFQQPNIERPTGGNPLNFNQSPPFVFFQGQSRYPEEGEVLQNKVVLVTQ